VTGGTSVTATVRLQSAAPTGIAVVSLASSNTVLAVVPNSVVVTAGQTSATFTVNTAQVTSSSSVVISATYQNATKSATLTLNPAGSTQTAALTVSATGRSGERVTSNPSGINVAVGSSGSGSFSTGTSITLSVSNGRSAIWSGACSSGGKTKTCTFTISGNASVAANVQ